MSPDLFLFLLVVIIVKLDRPELSRRRWWLTAFGLTLAFIIVDSLLRKAGAR